MAKVGTATSTNGAYDPASNDPDAVKAWEEAKNQAKDAGILWERPKDDTRSAQEIIDDTPILRDLGNQEDVKDMLEDRVGGDIETDADAAFRAAQVLEHIEKLDESGDRIVGGDVDNGRVDGFTSSDEARHGTEAGRLKDFGEQGFGFLKGELQDISSAADDPEARSQAEDLGIKWERPEDDDRSAEDIINDNPLLKNLGNQSQVKDMLKERVGDFEHDADAAYRAAQVLDHVEGYDEEGNRIASNDVGNGSIDGFTSSDEARHGTEAGRLQDFGKYGFSSLKGKMENPDTVGEDKAAREAAEKAGIKWELPEDDKRSAQDIIDDNPLLKNLGDQSGVKDMLKDRVGDFEKDADAAYRAAQVLDRVVMYDSDGKVQSGDDVANSSIDGFTSSDEARHGTEAGRLQDFGKYGFEALPAASKAEDSAGYKDFLKANPDADETSKKLALYTSVLNENFDSIRGKTDSGDYLTREALQKYKDENPQISDELKEAINFWSQPGAFEKLEAAQDPLKLKPDGKLGKSDMDNWITTYNPKDPNAAIGFITDVATANITAGVDTSKLTKDVFDNPDKYSAKEKAAVLQDLITARQLINDGAAAGMWSTDYGIVSIANSVRSHPDPEKLLEDVNAHIKTLEKDPEVIKLLNEDGAKQISDLLEDSKGLKDTIQTFYDDEIKTGKYIDTVWDKNTKDGKTDQPAALAEFFSAAKMYQGALGIDNVDELHKTINDSKHGDDFKDYYEKSLVSGDRLNELLKDHTFEEATSVFSTEVSLYNVALDPEFTGKFDDKLEENFTKIAGDNIFKDATFDDLKKAFGINGGDDLDEEKVKGILEEISKTNPEFFVNPDGTVTTPNAIITQLRGDWDLLRQGTKTLNELKLLSSDSPYKQSADKGIQHGVSGLLLAGVTIGRGVTNAGKLKESDIVAITTGSINSATLLAEGGIKNWRDSLKGTIKNLEGDLASRITSLVDDPPPGTDELKDDIGLKKEFGKNLERLENAAKGVGGLAGIAGGAYSIFDGVQALRKGDVATGAISIVSGSVSTLAGVASTVEGALGAFAPNIARFLPALAGGALGFIAAGIGAIAFFLPGLIAEGKQQTKQDNFGNLLSDYLTKYEIDGVPNGDIYDVPEDAWPDSE